MKTKDASGALVEELTRYRTALEQIANPPWAFDEAAKIARKALNVTAQPNDQDQRPGDTK